MVQSIFHEWYIPHPYRARGSLSREWAAFAGWLAVALWNVLTLLRQPANPDSNTRVLHVLIDLGHTMAMGLVVTGLVWAFRRSGWNSRVSALAWTAALGAALGQVAFVEDLEGVAARLAGDSEIDLVLRGCAALAGMAPAVALLTGVILVKFRVRWLGIVVGCAAIVVNNEVLVSGYPSLHTLLAVCAATLIGSSLAGMPIPSLPLVTRRAGLNMGAGAVVTAFALLSVVRPLPNGVEVEMLRRDTAFLAPWLLRLREPSVALETDVPPALRHWFQSRDQRPQIPPTPNRLLPRDGIVILVTIDALRYELMQSSKRKFAPNLHTIAERSVTFTQARSAGSDTRFSLAGLFAGRYYSMMEWTSRNGRRPLLWKDKRPRLVELLNEGGVTTSHFHTLPDMLTSRIGLVRGFQEEFMVPQDDSPQYPAESMVNEAIARLKKVGPEPLFIYMHIIEPHAPYHDHGQPLREEGKYGRYLNEVEFADGQLGRLHRAVTEFGLERRTAFIVSSDHGEGFGENGVHYHNKTLYDVVVRVPLMIQLPGVKPKVVTQNVSVIDIGPTILDLFQLPTPGFFMSETLTPFLIGGRANPNRLMFMETRAEYGMVFPDGIKVMIRRKGGTEEIYNVHEDPDEQRNLRETMGEEGVRRIELTRAFLEVHKWKGASE